MGLLDRFKRAATPDKPDADDEEVAKVAAR